MSFKYVVKIGVNNMLRPNPEGFFVNFKEWEGGGVEGRIQ